MHPSCWHISGDKPNRARWDRLRSELAGPYRACRLSGSASVRRFCIAHLVSSAASRSAPARSASGIDRAKVADASKSLSPLRPRSRGVFQEARHVRVVHSLLRQARRAGRPAFQPRSGCSGQRRESHRAPACFKGQSSLTGWSAPPRSLN